MQPTPHWTDTVLAAALDPAGGGGGDIGAAARTHALQCPACAEALGKARDAERAVADVLRTLDHTVPSVDMAQIITRASAPGSGGVLRRASDKTVIQRSGRQMAPASHRANWGIGAVILGIAAIAAAAVPGSSLHHLIARIFVSPAPRYALPTPPRPAQSPSAGAMPQAARGVALVPRGPIAILFRSTQATGVIRISAGNRPDVAVHGDGDGATYAIGQDTIVVENSGTSTLNYDVELPLAAQCPTVHLLVGDQLVYSRLGDRIITRATPDATGRYVIPLGGTETHVH